MPEWAFWWSFAWLRWADATLNVVKGASFLTICVLVRKKCELHQEVCKGEGRIRMASCHPYESAFLEQQRCCARSFLPWGRVRRRTASERRTAAAFEAAKAKGPLALHVFLVRMPKGADLHIAPFRRDLCGDVSEGGGRGWGVCGYGEVRAGEELRREGLRERDRAGLRTCSRTSICMTR